MGMKVEIGREANNGGRTMQIGVDGWAKASAIVRAYIEEFHLGQRDFTGGKVVIDGKVAGRISYNGRAWDTDGKEVVL